MCKASSPEVGEGAFIPLHEIWPLEAASFPHRRKYRQGGRYFRSSLHLHFNGRTAGLLSRRSGSTAGRAGTSGIPVVPVALPVLLPVNNRGAPELAPEVDAGSKHGVFKPVRAEVPLDGPVLPVYRKFRSHFRCNFRRLTGAYRYLLRKWAPEVITGSTAECTGTSGLPEVPVQLPVQLPGNSRGGAEVPPVVPTGSSSGSTGKTTGTSGEHRKPSRNFFLRRHFLENLHS